MTFGGSHPIILKLEVVWKCLKRELNWKSNREGYKKVRSCLMFAGLQSTGWQGELWCEGSQDTLLQREHSQRGQGIGSP